MEGGSLRPASPLPPHHLSSPLTAVGAAAGAGAAQLGAVLLVHAPALPAARRALRPPVVPVLVAAGDEGACGKPGTPPRRAPKHVQCGNGPATEPPPQSWEFWGSQRSPPDSPGAFWAASCICSLSSSRRHGGSVAAPRRQERVSPQTPRRAPPRPCSTSPTRTFPPEAEAPLGGGDAAVPGGVAGVEEGAHARLVLVQVDGRQLGLLQVPVPAGVQPPEHPPHRLLAAGRQRWGGEDAAPWLTRPHGDSGGAGEGVAQRRDAPVPGGPLLDPLCLAFSRSSWNQSRSRSPRSARSCPVHSSAGTKCGWGGDFRGVLWCSGRGTPSPNPQSPPKCSPCLLSVGAGQGHCPSHRAVSCLPARHACCSSLHCEAWGGGGTPQ